MVYSEPQGISSIETSNLDGETNLKIRQALPETSKFLDTTDLSRFTATVECEQPNRHLYEFTGNLKETNKKYVIINIFHIYFYMLIFFIFTLQNFTSRSRSNAFKGFFIKKYIMGIRSCYLYWSRFQIDEEFDKGSFEKINC